MDTDIDAWLEANQTEVDERELGAISGEDINTIEFDEEDVYCPYCWSELQEIDEDKFVCSNDMCLNETEYDSEGDIYE